MCFVVLPKNVFFKDSFQRRNRFFKIEKVVRWLHFKKAEHISPKFCVCGGNWWKGGSFHPFFLLMCRYGLRPPVYHFNTGICWKMPKWPKPRETSKFWGTNNRTLFFSLWTKQPSNRLLCSEQGTLSHNGRIFSRIRILIGSVCARGVFFFHLNPNLVRHTTKNTFLFTTTARVEKHQETIINERLCQWVWAGFRRVKGRGEGLRPEIKGGSGGGGKERLCERSRKKGKSSEWSRGRGVTVPDSSYQLSTHTAEQAAARRGKGSRRKNVQRMHQSAGARARAHTHPHTQSHSTSSAAVWECLLSQDVHRRSRDQSGLGCVHNQGH